MTPEIRIVLSIAALIVGVCMVLAGFLLSGFTRHRLRAWNIYFTFSVAALSFVRFAEYATGEVHATLVLVTWGNLAIGSVIGLVGVRRLAKSDPPVFRFRR